MDVDRSSVTHRSCKKDGKQSSWFNAMVDDCLCLLKAVAINEISSNRLKTRKMAFSHLGSIRHIMTARIMWRAVEISEISSYRLKARKMALSHLGSIRHIMTARVMWRAVEISETTFLLVLVKN